MCIRDRFGAIQNSTVKNLGVASGETLSASDIGGLVGAATNSKISCCYTDVEISGSITAPICGSMAGSLFSSTMENCYSPVSYTHLDVYKRQPRRAGHARAAKGLPLIGSPL